MPYYARYFDGDTATPHQVTLHITDNRLTGYAASGEICFTWPFKEMLLIQKPEENREGLLTLTANRKLRLSITKENYRVLHPFLSRKQRKPLHKTLSIQVLFFSLLLIAGTLIMIFHGVPLLAHFFAQNTPTSWEQEIGEHSLSFLINEEKYCSSQKGKAALQQIASRLQEANPMIPPLTFHVIDDMEANATTVPGNHIILYHGLLEQTQTPEELTGVIAHEVAHILKKDALETFFSEAGSTLLLYLLFGSASELPMLGHTLLQLKHSQEAEKQADALAYQLLEKAHINPTSIATLFERMAKTQPEEYIPLFSYLSTHPRMEERVLLLSQKTHSEKNVKPILSEEAWQNIKTMCGTQHE